MLIPFYYITSKIASEKESKAREGMKMMGLTDGTYFLSWFIFYGGICFITALIMTIMANWIFKNIDLFLYFLFCLFYALTLYGQAFAIVAFLPTKRSSGIAATLFHIVSYYMIFIIADPATPSGIQYGLSILPNICMG
jgi:ATP-binding cassette subfamily A (ABC1) protein 3